MAASFTLSQLAEQIGGTFTGEGSVLLTGLVPLDSAKEGHLTFLTNPKYAKLAEATNASAILLEKPIEGLSKPFLLVSNPYAKLPKLIQLFYPPFKPEPGIQEGAWVHPKASVDPSACLYPGTVVASGAKVGARSLLYPGAFLGQEAVVGEDCILYSNVTVREKCVLGNRVILQPGVVIGGDGFGFAPDRGTYEKIPQVGNVVLEDDVEIGANTCVDRAALGSTRIGKGTKLDNLIQIGHNVVIGESTIIVSQTGISGSTQIGNHVVMGGQVGLAGHLKIGDQVILATRTGVMEDIPEKGVYWGSPSSPMTVEMKNVAAYRQLPDLVKRVRRLEKLLEKMGKNEPL